MRARRLAIVAAALAAVAIGLWAWRTFGPGDQHQIRRRLSAFTEDFNSSTTDGLGTVARAAKIGSYFTEDVTVDLGQGTGPINGRETLIGMAARLQPRTAAFRMELDDVTVEVAPGGVAEVRLTVAFFRRSLTSGEESIDASEFSLGLRKADGEWRVGRITAVDTLR